MLLLLLVSSDGEEPTHDMDKKVVAFDPNIIGARTDSFKSTRVGGTSHMTVTCGYIDTGHTFIVWVLLWHTYVCTYLGYCGQSDSCTCGR